MNIEESQPKGKKIKPTLLTEQDLTANYKYLPFQAADIEGLYPVVKSLHQTSNDVRSVVVQANIAMKEQALDRAFELYSQAISVLLQITGPMEREVATYIS